MDAPKEPRSLAGEYLEQALDALHAAGDSHSLYPAWALAPRAKLQSPALGFALVLARTARRRSARNAALFSALAAEAYVNEFLAAYLAGDDLATVDRWPTVDKYVKGTRRAFDGAQLFWRGVEPMPTIRRLFKLRDQLVHPKPGYEPGWV